MTITIGDVEYLVETEEELLHLLPRLAIYAFRSERGQETALPARDILSQIRRRPQAWRRTHD